jgi:hypothetical protein
MEFKMYLLEIFYFFSHKRFGLVPESLKNVHKEIDQYKLDKAPKYVASSSFT